MYDCILLVFSKKRKKARQDTIFRCRCFAIQTTVFVQFFGQRDLQRVKIAFFFRFRGQRIATSLNQILFAERERQKK